MWRWLRPLRPVAAVAVVAGLAAFVLGRFGAVYIAGRSMEPALRPGDLVVYRRAPASVATGDIVVLRRPGWKRRVVHRVAEVMPDGSFTTRGDANALPDSDRSFGGVCQGVVIGVLPLGRGVAAVVWGLTWCYNRLPIANTRL
jgi:signal peptidase I